MAVDLVNLGPRPNSALRPQQYVEMMTARVRKHRGLGLEHLRRRSRRSTTPARRIYFDHPVY
jgi:hypothetical protein